MLPCRRFGRPQRRREVDVLEEVFALRVVVRPDERRRAADVFAVRFAVVRLRAEDRAADFLADDVFRVAVLRDDDFREPPDVTVAARLRRAGLAPSSVSRSGGRRHPSCVASVSSGVTRRAWGS